MSVLSTTHPDAPNLVKKTLAEADIFRGDVICLDRHCGVELCNEDKQEV